MRYTLFFMFCLGCAPEWVDVQDAAIDTKESTDQVEDNNSEENNSSENIEDENIEDENIEDENIENEDSENNPSENQNTEENTDSDNTEEDRNSENNPPDDTEEDPSEDTVDYVGSYIGTFSGATDYGYGYVEEFCSGTLEVDLSSNYNLTGETICETYQGSWTYSFEGEASESGSDINIVGTMTASDQFGSSFSTELNGFIIIDNNDSYMSLEWEFPDYSIIGNADLELQ